MKYYAYPGNNPHGEEKLGSLDKLMFEYDPRKFVVNIDILAIRRCKKIYRNKPFMLYKYTNPYDNKTFRLVHQQPS